MSKKSYVLTIIAVILVLIATIIARLKIGGVTNIVGIILAVCGLTIIIYLIPTCIREQKILKKQNRDNSNV